MIDQLDAITEMYQMFSAGLNSFASAITGGYVPEIRVHGVEKTDVPDESKIWCRWSYGITDDRVREHKGESSSQTYHVRGIVFIQFFAPVDSDGSYNKIERLANQTKKIFRGKSTSGSIQFVDSRTQELPSEENWHRINVVCRYRHDEQGD